MVKITFVTLRGLGDSILPTAPLFEVLFIFLVEKVRAMAKDIERMERKT